MVGGGEHRFLTELIQELLSTPMGTQNLQENPVLCWVGVGAGRCSHPVSPSHGNPRDAPAPPCSLAWL